MVRVFIIYIAIIVKSKNVKKMENIQSGVHYSGLHFDSRDIGDCLCDQEQTTDRQYWICLPWGVWTYPISFLVFTRNFISSEQQLLDTKGYLAQL